MFPGNEANFEIEFLNIKEKLYKIYKADCQRALKELLEEDKDNWDDTTRSLLILLHLLPPTAKGNKKCVKEPVRHLSEKLITFKPVITFFILSYC